MATKKGTAASTKAPVKKTSTAKKGASKKQASGKKASGKKSKPMSKPKVEADAGTADQVRKDDERRRASVTVFGAGITGLAAAHELIERGFDVQVVDKATSDQEYGTVAIGGVMKSQYTFGLEPGPSLYPDPIRQRPKAYGVPQNFLFHAPDTESKKPLLPNPWEFDGELTLKDEDIANSWVEPRNDAKLTAAADSLKALAEAWKAAGLTDTILLRLVGHTDADLPPREARDLGERRAESLREVLEIALGADKKSFNFETRSAGSTEPIGDDNTETGRRRNNRARIEIKLMRVPGEHGYRFYPRFYKMLDDVLGRIPVYDQDGNETHRRVLDNLRSAESSRFATADGQDPIRFERKRPRSFEEIRRTAQELAERLKFPLEDIAYFEMKMFKFLTASHERRRDEYSAMTWHDFVELKRYSPNVQAHMEAAPQALVGMGANETDAHTAGNIYCQLLLDHLTDGAHVDRTMNGPTSEVFLRHWKTYLVKRGVKFFAGNLKFLRASGEIIQGKKGPKPKLEAVVVGVRDWEDATTAPDDENGFYLFPEFCEQCETKPSGHKCKDYCKKYLPPIPEPRYTDETQRPRERRRAGIEPDPSKRWNPDTDYMVLALPTKEAVRVLNEKKPVWKGGTVSEQPILDDADLDGALLQLRKYDVGERKGKKGPHSGPLRDFSGIQFYMGADFKIARGHVYFPDSDWGLSSVSQMQFWNVERTPEQGYLGILSVDLGNLHEPDRSAYREPLALAATALVVAGKAAQSIVAKDTGELDCKKAYEDLTDLLDSNYRDAHDLAREFPKDQSDPFQRAVEALRTKVMEFEPKDHAGAEAGDASDIKALDFLTTALARPELATIPSMVPDSFMAAGPSVGATLEEVKVLTAEVRRVAASSLEKSLATMAEAFLVSLGAFLEIRSDPACGEFSGDPKDPRVRAFQSVWSAIRQLYCALEVGAVTKVGDMKTAWDSKPEEIAKGVWNQIKIGLNATLSEQIPDPVWYHLDDALIFDKQSKELVENRALYQINRPKAFQDRPGVMPYPADHPEAARYEVSNYQWLVTGMFTKTFTRLSTMELGVESARHAVGSMIVDWREEKDQLLLGEPPKILNPEEDELDDLAFLKRIDQRLHAENLPHLIDILRIEDALEALLRERKRGAKSILDEMNGLLSAVFRTGEEDLRIPGVDTRDIGRNIEKAVDSLDNFLERRLGLRLPRPYFGERDRD